MLLPENLVKEMLGANRRALARAISLIENDAPEKEAILGQLFPHTGRAHSIGITGPPGAGKSSLVDRLAAYARKLGLTLGIIAVDPTSPFSGGALLGDRIRMQAHALDPGVFIRSMGTRGSLGGLARNTKQVMQVLDAFGRDLVVVETVGVGQSELDIAQAADSVVLVLTPTSGDAIQTLKAGIMEIADVFVVNKCDVGPAEELVREINAMLDLGPRGDWRPPVIKTNSLAGEGIQEVYSALKGHWDFLRESGRISQLRRERLEQSVLEAVFQQLRDRLEEEIRRQPQLEQLLRQVQDRELDPYTAASSVVSSLGIGAASS